jgi:pimeloyl-ACP methyl ester carboxylesterase
VGEQMVTVDGQQIAFLQSEGDGRAVVFVHGNSSSARTWLPVLTGPFGRRFRCLAFDLPGHGQSAAAADHSAYSLPGYAAVLAGFTQACGAAGAVIVGWSLGGHIALEAAPAMPAAAGYVIFGTPPVACAAQMADAFLPNPAMNVGFTADVSPELARVYAASFTTAGSVLRLDEFTAASCVPTAPRGLPCSPASARAGSPTSWRSSRRWGGPWRSCTVRVSNW